VTLHFALGGDETCWLYLPVAEGRAGWPRLVDPALPAALLALHAHSPQGDLAHPGEVPFPAETTLLDLLADIEAELGPEVTVVELRLRYPGGLVLAASGETEVRLESERDAAFAAPLARWSGWREERLVRLLAALRSALLTGLFLAITAAPEGTLVVAHPSRTAFLRGDRGESFALAV
jgi:hypothetical protein